MRVLVTGASSGIGEACAYRFGRERARVALLARREERLARVAERVREAGGQPLILVADVSLRDAVNEAVARAESAFGGLDVLVNNAGFGIVAPVEALRQEDLHRIFAVNTFGAIYCTQAALPGMKRQGRGVIINVSSILGKRALPMSGAYCASKFAMQAFSESLRIELRGTGIRVSVVCPGYTETDFGKASVNYGYSRRGPRGMKMRADKVAEVIVDCARRPRREVMMTIPGKLLVQLNRFSPRLTDWVLTRIMKHARSVSPPTEA